MHFASNLPQPRRTLAVPLMAAAVLGAGIATATFALVNIEDEPIVSLPTPVAEPAAVPSDAVAGQRADGGPEEGAAVQSINPQTAPQASASASAAAAGIRYDGGPEEGSRGAIAEQPLPAGTRYDGGPDEGSRAVVTEQPDTSIAGGPTPYSGARP
jgi:hypothetical protein